MFLNVSFLFWRYANYFVDAFSFDFDAFLNQFFRFVCYNKFHSVWSGEITDFHIQILSLKLNYTIYISHQWI